MARDDAASLLSHIRTFVDPEEPPLQQHASCCALVNFVTRKNTSLLQIVKEMENYLTATDVAIRARGILLLGEIWIQLYKHHMEDTVIHTFADFFAARIEDWHALHGALLGSLALIKRGKDVGAVNEEDAKLLAESALQNLEVQSLSQTDRMLCFEFFEVLLLHHRSIVVSLGVSFAESICAAVEGEKDPRCLLIAFHIVELLMKLFPDLDGDIEDLSEDIFGVISCYFPISFNPLPDDKRGITREDLSVALMHAFASSTLFADSCIQLFLEKLSSSLRTAKLDALKFLGFCCLHYGSETLQKHAATIWASLKQELLVSQAVETMGMKEDRKIITEALECFKACITASQEGNYMVAELGERNRFLNLVLQDPFLDDLLKCLPAFLVWVDGDDATLLKTEHDHSLSDKTSLAVERAIATITQTSPILAAAIKASNMSCFSVLSILLKKILEFMKLPGSLQETEVLTFYGETMPHLSLCFTESIAIAVLGLLNMIIEAATDIAENLHTSTSTVTFNTSSMTQLQYCFTQLMRMFSWIILAGLQKSNTKTFTSPEKIWQMGVAGLQVLASFPPKLAVITENQYQFILSFLTWIILEKPEVGHLWDRAVEAFSCICEKEEKFSSARFGYGKTDLLIESLINHLSDDTIKLSRDHNLRALAAICKKKSGMSIIVVKETTKLIQEKLQSPSAAKGSNMGVISMLLQGLFEHILPCCQNTGSENRALFELSLVIWSSFENFALTSSLQNNEILEVSMAVFRTSVCKCDGELQQALLSRTLDYSVESRDICIIGLFASLVISLRPSIQILRKQVVLYKLLETAVSPSCNHVSDIAIEAISCMVNKWVDVSTEESLTNGSTFSLPEAVHMILKGEWILKDDLLLVNGPVPLDNSELYVKLRCIKLLASISKGLAMKGDVIVAEFATLLLELVVLQNCPNNKQNDALLYFIWPKEEEISAVGIAAAEGLGFIVKGQGTFLNKNHHAIIRPLYQQRFFLSILSLLTRVLKQADTDCRVRLYYAFGNIVSGIPTSVLIAEAEKVLPLLLQSMSSLCHEKMQSEILLSLLLVLSALLVDKNGAKVCSDHLPTIVNSLLKLVHYPFSMMVRETTLLCLGAVVALPHTLVFPLRNQVQKALLGALDDPKRAVRKEAIRCRRAWDAITR